SLPSGGAGRGHNGDMALSGVSLALVRASNERPIDAPFENASSDINPEEAKSAIDDHNDTGFSIQTDRAKPHCLVLRLREPLTIAENERLRIDLKFLDPTHPASGLGRFRLSVSRDQAALDREQNRFAAMRLADPWLKLAAAYALYGHDDEALHYISTQ